MFAVIPTSYRSIPKLAARSRDVLDSKLLSSSVPKRAVHFKAANRFIVPDPLYEYRALRILRVAISANESTLLIYTNSVPNSTGMPRLKAQITLRSAISPRFRAQAFGLLPEH